jgi:hypothetical protein
LQGWLGIQGWIAWPTPKLLIQDLQCSGKGKMSLSPFLWNLKEKVNNSFLPKPLIQDPQL